MFHLVCVTPFHNYTTGQIVKDPAEIEKLTGGKDHHFVRIPAPPEEVQPVEKDHSPHPTK